MDKVIPVAGDVTLEGFGISPEDLKLLCDEVSIVFNSAATVRFDEDLRTAVDLNVKGPQRLMNVCHQMKRLEVATSLMRFSFTLSQIMSRFFSRLSSTFQRLTTIWTRKALRKSFTRRLLRLASCLKSSTVWTPTC